MEQMLTASSNLLPIDGEVFYWPHLFSESDSQFIFNQLMDETEWRAEEIVLFGKSIMQPRLIAWHGDEGIAYQYSGLRLQAQPWTPLLLKIKSKVEQQCKQTFNSVLLNLYRHQQDSNGWHSDDEKELGPRPTIASVSLGQQRDFLLKHKQDQSKKVKMPLESGSLLVMAGDCQKYWKHCLPKRAGFLGPRINLTFRQIAN